MQLKNGILVLALVGMLPTAAAAVTEDNFTLRNTGDLVALCSAAPSDPLMTPALNFCDGFAVGVYQVLQAQQAALRSGPWFCVPNPTPTRTQTVAAFVQWANANPQSMSQPAADGIAQFLGQRFPCARKR
jgi:hypothetical protein